MTPRPFTPTITPATKAAWELFGRLSPLIHPTGGINWRDYVRSGGPARYLGKR